MTYHRTALSDFHYAAENGLGNNTAYQGICSGECLRVTRFACARTPSGTVLPMEYGPEIGVATP